MLDSAFAKSEMSFRRVCVAAQARAGKDARWVPECIISRFYCISEITINKVLQLKGNIWSDYAGWFIACSPRLCGESVHSRNAPEAQTGSYLFHVSVVHGVVRHLIQLQLNNLFELVAVAFPLAHDDHFIKQEYVPEDTSVYSSFKRESRPGPGIARNCLWEFTCPVSFGWRWSTPSARRRSLACRTPPVSPAA